MTKKKTWMPQYHPSSVELEAYKYCVRNDILLSPGGTGKYSEWTIDVKVKKGDWRKSPSAYGPEDIWKEYYKACNFYYQKRKK